MRRVLALSFATVLLLACNGRSPTAPEDAVVPFETVVSASVSGFTSSERRAVRSAGEWAEVWQTIHAGQSPVPPVPALDFDRELALLAAAGTRSNGCFTIEFTQARTARGILVLDVTETVPGRDCSCIQVVTQPLHVIRIVRLPAPEVFVERRRQLAC